MSEGLTKWGERFGLRKFERWEVFGIRALFAWLVYRVLPLDATTLNISLGQSEWFGNGGWFGPAGKIAYNEAKNPVGLANYFDVTFMGDQAIQPYLWGLCILALILYVWGRGFMIALPILLLVTVLGRTLKIRRGSCSTDTNSFL